MDQHYLPKCYLKEFCETGHDYLYKINCGLIKQGRRGSYRKMHPSEGCYEKDYFTITDDFKKLYPRFQSYEPYFIEKQFHSYETLYPAIINQLKSGQKWLSFKDAQLLIYALFEFKIRNRFFRNNTEISKRKVAGDLFDEYLLDTKKRAWALQTFHITENELTKHVSKMRDDIISDTHYAKHSHIAAILMRYENNNSMHDFVISNLLMYKWVIFKSDRLFLTSDNPGYSIGVDNVVYNTRFLNGFHFVFPLTPSMCLCITDDVIDLKYYNNMSIKNIESGLVSDDIVSRVNNMCLKHVINYVYSGDKNVIEFYSKDIKWVGADY